MIALKNVKKKCGSVEALKGVTASICEGELLSITGPSGSGKSTLLHLMGLLDQPTEGELFFQGRECSSLTDEELSHLRGEKMGFVFQAFYLLSELTAWENVLLPFTYVSRYPGYRDYAEMLLERVGLKSRLGHTPSQLSGGEAQRVALVRALVTKPKILLADEPTGSLDQKTGEELFSLFDELHSEGLTIAFVTHDPKLAARAQRTLRMKDGLLDG